MYFLMHENNKIAAFNTDIADNILSLSINKNALDLIPIGVKNNGELALWIRNRAIPVTRHNIKEDLHKYNNISTFKFMLLNNGLSLTDHYWILNTDTNKNVNWDSINCYTNNFKSKASINITDDISVRELKSHTIFTPSASLQGNLKKKWIIDKHNNRMLIKGTYNNCARQSISEVFASEIHKLQNVCRYTHYDLIRLKYKNSDVLGCICSNFTDTEKEFIPAIDVVSMYKKPNNISYYEFYIKICEEHGIYDIRHMLEYQILSDFIISNDDRHFNNFGILRNSKTLEWVGYAPIFDSGNSLFYKQSYIPVDRKLLRIETSSFKTKEVELLKYVHNKTLLNVCNLPNEENLMQLLAKDNNTKQSDNIRIIKAYKKKIKYTYDFQNGASIWNREQYKG